MKKRLDQSLYQYILPLCFAFFCIYNGIGFNLTIALIITIVVLPIIKQTLLAKSLPKLNPTDVCVFIFTAWILISLTWSQDIDFSFSSLHKIGLLGLAYATTRFLGLTASINEPINRLFICIAVIFSFFPILDQIAVNDSIRSGGFFFDPNVAGIIIIFSCIQILYLSIFLSKKTKNKIYLDFLFGVCIYSLLVTGSRSALLSFTPTILILGFLSFTSYKPQQVIKKWSGPFLTGLAALFINISIDNSLLSRFGSVANEVSDPHNPRSMLFKGALDIYNEYNFFGSGIGTYPTMYNQVRKEYSELGYFAHNDYLQILSETGVLGLVSFLGLLTLCIIYLKNSIKERKQHSNLTYSTALPISLWLTGLFIQAMFYFVFYIPATSLLAGVCLAMLANQKNRTQKTQETKQPIFFKMIMLFPIFVLIYWLFYDAYFISIKDKQKKPSIASIEQVNKLAFFSFGKEYPKLALSNEYYNLAVEEKRKNVQIKLLIQGLENSCLFVKRNKFKKEGYNSLANMYFGLEQLGVKNKKCEKGLPQNKIESLEKTIKVSPAHSIAERKLLITWLINEHNYKSAKKHKRELNFLIKTLKKSNALIINKNEKNEKNENTSYSVRQKNVFFSSIFYDIRK